MDAEVERRILAFIRKHESEIADLFRPRPEVSSGRPARSELELCLDWYKDLTDYEKEFLDARKLYGINTMTEKQREVFRRIVAKCRKMEGA